MNNDNDGHVHASCSKAIVIMPSDDLKLVKDKALGETEELKKRIKELEQYNSELRIKLELVKRFDEEKSE